MLTLKVRPSQRLTVNGSPWWRIPRICSPATSGGQQNQVEGRLGQDQPEIRELSQPGSIKEDIQNPISQTEQSTRNQDAAHDKRMIDLRRGRDTECGRGLEPLEADQIEHEGCTGPARHLQEDGQRALFYARLQHERLGLAGVGGMPSVAKGHPLRRRWTNCRLLNGTIPESESRNQFSFTRTIVCQV